MRTTGKSEKMRDCENGFTLLEVVIAIGIFSVGMLAVAALQTRGLAQTTNTREYTEAVIFANSKADELLALAIYTDENYSQVHEKLRAGSQTETVGQGRYEVTWNVQDDIPIAKQPNPKSSLLGSITVSKLVYIEVAKQGESEPLAKLEFVKVLLE